MYNKGNYICTKPFKELQLYKSNAHICCPGWLEKPIGNGDSLNDLFHNDIAQDIRESILDGSYKYCNENHCPALSELNAGKIHDWFIPKTKRNIKKITTNISPKDINFNFDESCNFKCPSCRTDYINYKGNDRLKVDNWLDRINTELSKDIETMYISGSCDPFYSKSFRLYLESLNVEDYPNLKKIHIHTNGSLWTENMWNKLFHIHEYITSCEISIDAGTKDTYENKVRLGGEWDKLLNNLSFICNIPTIKRYSFSFVVQDNNYTEMLEFYNVIENLMKHRDPQEWCCYYLRIINWGTFNEGEFKLKDVADPTHPEYGMFIDRLKDVIDKPNCLTNMGHLIS